MGLFNWLTKEELQQPYGVYEAAYGSVYASDIIRDAGLDPSQMSPEELEATVAYIRKRTKEIAEKRLKQIEELSKEDMSPIARAVGWAGSKIAPTAPAAQAYETYTRAERKAKEDVAAPFIVDDVTPTKRGEQGRYLREIAAGLREGPPESGRLARWADIALQSQNLGGGALRLPGVEVDPTAERPKWERVVEQGIALGAALPEIALLTRVASPFAGAGAGMVGLGAYEALDPRAKTLKERAEKFAHGAAIGAAAHAFTALRAPFIRTMFKGSPEILAKAERYLIEGGVGRHMAAGELGGLFSVGEKISRGETPTLEDYLIGYAAFALAHAPAEFSTALKPQSRAFRRAERDLRLWEKSDDPEAVVARKLLEGGDVAGYRSIIKNKLRLRTGEILREIAGEKVDKQALVDRSNEIIDEYFDGLDRWEQETKDAALKGLEQRNAPPEQPTPEEEAYRQQRAEREADVAYAERRRQIDEQLLAEEEPDRRLTRAEAVKTIAREAGVSKNKARRILGGVQRQISEGGQRYYLEGEVLKQARIAAERRVAEARARNKRDVTLRKYKTQGAARRAAKRAVKQSGGEAFDVYEEEPGVWRVRPRREFIDATERPPELDRPTLTEPRPKPSESLDEELALKRIGANGRRWAERQRKLEEERKARGKKLVAKVAAEIAARKSGEKIRSKFGKSEASKKIRRYKTTAERIAELKARSPEARKAAEIEEAKQRAHEKAVKEALAEGALTAEEARRLRLKEAEERRKALEAKRAEIVESEMRAAAERSELAAERRRALTAQEIVDLSRQEGGMGRLKEMGYEQIDVLRAVHELKRGAPPPRAEDAARSEIDSLADEAEAHIERGGQPYAPSHIAILQRLGQALLPGVRLQSAEDVARSFLALRRGDATEAEFRRVIDDKIASNEVSGVTEAERTAARKRLDAADKVDAAESPAAKREAPKLTRPDPYTAAAEMYRSGIGRQESWSRWIQRTELNPGMDAKDWYRIYDSVAGGGGDVVIGSLLGGVTPEQWLETFDLVRKGARAGAHLGVRTVGGAAEGVNRLLTVADLVTDPVMKRIYRNTLFKNMRTRIEELGDALAKKLGTTNAFGRLIVELTHFNALDTLPSDLAKEDIRTFIGKRNIAVRDARVMGREYNKLVTEARKEFNKHRKSLGLKRLTEEEFDDLFLALVNYSKPDMHGNRPGLREIESVLRDAREEGIEINERLLRLVEDTGNIIEHLDEMPDGLRQAIATTRDYFERSFKDMLEQGLLGERYTMKEFETEASARKFADRVMETRGWSDPRVEKIKDGWVVTGKTGALPDGLSYIPLAYTESIEAPDVVRVGQRKGREISKAAPMFQRHYHRGIFERLILLGEKPRTSKIGDLIARYHVDVATARLSRDMATGLLMRVVEKDGAEYPAAVTERQLRAIMADKIKRERGVSDEQVDEVEVEERMSRFITRNQYHDYSEVPGFRLYSESGTPEKLYLHPDVARVIQRVREAPYHHWVFRANAALKVLKLSMSPFHYWALIMNSYALGADPLKAWTNWEKLENSKTADEAMMRGLTIHGGDIYIGHEGYETIFGPKGIKGVDWFMRQIRHTEEFFNRKLWDELFVATKVAAWEVQKRRIMEWGYSEKEAGEMAADVVNRLQGGLNLHWHGISVRVKQALGFIMLAPDWTISNGMSSAGIAFGIGPVADASRIMFARYLMGHIVFGNILNYLMSGHMMWENEDGHKHEIEISDEGILTQLGEKLGLDFTGHKYWMDIAGHMFELYKVALGGVNDILPGDPIPEGYRRGLVPYLRGKTSQIGGLFIESATGKQQFSPYALPTVEDIKAGKTHGAFGKSDRSIEAIVIATYQRLLPITFENTAKAVIEHGDKFYTDARFLSIFGRHVKEKRAPKTRWKPSGGRTGLRRGRRATRRGLRRSRR